MLSKRGCSSRSRDRLNGEFRVYGSVVSGLLASLVNTVQRLRGEKMGISAAPAALTLAGFNRRETSGCGCALVSSAAARRRFPQARPGSPANGLRHSTSAGSGYTQLPVIRNGNVRKLARGNDPAGVEPPAAQSGARSPHSKVARSMRPRWETQLGDRDSHFPTHSLRRRSL